MARPHRRRKGPEEPDFSTLSFSQLIERDERLAELRRSYARKPAEERRAAANWAYHAESAASLFGQALAGAGHDRVFSPTWPPGIESLAIDPTYAPALLTVGSIEQQLGRRTEARELFQVLLTLPRETPDLERLIDKAGMFWLDEDEWGEALQLYEQACAVFPENTDLLGGWGYSLAKLGRRDEAVAIQRRALALAPQSSALLSDLGWALTESGQYDEAETVLKEAVRLAPADYDRPRGNLEELRRRRRGGREGRRRTTDRTTRPA